MPFSQKTLDFLEENRLRDDRDWYNDHKPEFQEYVLEPLRELVARLAPAMLAIDPEFVTEPKVDKTISRVYRDTRYSHDKSLYRDVMWCVFRRDKKSRECPPGFVLELSPRGFRYGCGYYCTPPKTMEAIRALILKGDRAFREAKEAYDSQSVFGLEGESYKRSRYPDEPEDLRLWLDKKHMVFMRNSQDFCLLFSEGLADILIRDFQLLRPMYALFWRGEAEAGKREAERF